MKRWIPRLMAVFAAGLLVPAAAQTTTNEMPEDNGPPPMEEQEPPSPPDMSPDDAGQPAMDDAEAAPAQDESVAPVRIITPHRIPQRTSSASQPVPGGTNQNSSAFMPPGESAASNPDELRLNFDNVPLNMVLNYLSDAAGFVIVLDTQVHGNVSVISSHPLTRDQAVDLLNSVLNQNGYAAIRDGQTLTIMDKSDAKTRDIPVHVGNDPDAIPKNDVIVTQIIPVRYVDATQLVSDLASFVSPQATIVANQAGNSIVVTDTQDNIHHLVEIIEAIDQSAAGETEIQVFPLKYANPNDVASELGQIFPSGSTGNGQNNMPIRFGGPGGFFARMMAANAAANSDNNRAQKQSQVTAVADDRTQSIIVMASKDLMPQIAGMMEQLDVPSPRDQKVYAFHLNNADPQEVAQILQSAFQSSTSSRGSTSSSSQQQTENSALIQRENQNATTVGQTSSSISSGTGTGESRGLGGGGGLNP